MKTVALFSLTLVSLALARTFTVSNECDFTVWPGLYTDPLVGPARPDQPTGWEAPPGTSVSFFVPDEWKAGRIWGRTGCDFSNPIGATACDTGSCNGGLLCDPHSGTGVPPASVAEWTLSGADNQDWYDVSLVDGSNIPMAITNNKECAEASCTVCLNAGCPAELALVKDGRTVGCKSACSANLDGNQQNSRNCCSGQFDKPETCPCSGVQFYDYFKKSCTNSYVFAYDESSKTALFTCNSALKADYTLTFCPKDTKKVKRAVHKGPVHAIRHVGL